MNHSSVSKIIGTSILTLSLAVLPLSLPVSAQNNTEANQNEGNNNGAVLDRSPLQETRGDGDNWGWLGLIGLVGLINLFRKGKEPVEHNNYQENNRITTEEPVNNRGFNEVSGLDNTGTTTRYKDPNETKRPD